MNVTHGLQTGQVLQRRRQQKAVAHLVGKCSTGGIVRARITKGGRLLNGWKMKIVGRAARGAFTVKLDGIPVGGPYNITLSVGAESVTIPEIFVGDVWLLGGQSNMYGCALFNKTPRSHPLVRAMYMDYKWRIAREPIHFLPDSPDPVHNTIAYSETARDKMRRAAVRGVGPAVYFGREMLRRSGGVPQGLICTAHGGTSMEQRDPAKKKLGGASLYGSMLQMVRQTAQPVAGVLWYQGESDANENAAPLYTQRMIHFIRALRRDLGQPRLPFLMAQIGRVFGENFKAKAWNSIQQQQLALRRKISGLDVVATVNLPLDDTIHVGYEGMPRLGMRFARLADRLVYGNRRELPVPELVSIARTASGRMKLICPHRLTLTFKNVVGGFRATGEPSGFALVDANHVSPNAIYKVVLDSKKIHLETPLENKEGFYQLMYGHGTVPCANITDSRDMPIPVFGPIPINPPTFAYTPFILRWRASRLLPSGQPITRLPPPSPNKSLGLRTIEANEWSFVDMHLDWAGKSGLCIFFTEIALSEAMKLNLLFGYDGPAKVWVDDRTVFCDPKGSNPAIPDAGKAQLYLKQGSHRVTVAMDTNEGKAWGFFLRFRRRDVSKKRIANRDFAVPVCTLKAR